MSIFNKRGSDRNRNNMDETGIIESIDTDDRPEDETSDMDDMPEDEMPAQDARVRRKRSGKWRRGRHNARKRERKLRERKPLGKKPFIIAGSIVGGLVLIYLGVAAFFMSHFLVNTTINGKDFSGKTVADVEDYLKEQVDGYQLTLVEQNNITDTISGSEISLEYKKNKDVENSFSGSLLSSRSQIRM